MGADQFFHSFSSGAGTGIKAYHQGEPTSGEVSGLFAVALNGQTFLIDEKVGVRRSSIPLLRSQADTSNLRGEASINPEELWRRAQETWHHGAGQTYLDRPESNPARFRSSKGVDVWDKWQLSLLPETDQKRTSGFTNLALLPVGDRLYLAEGPEVYFTADITVGAPTWTDTNVQAGEGDRTVESITTDGFNVYAALGANGIHTTTRGATSWTHFGNNPTGKTYTLVGHVKGRLMAAAQQSLYNLTASGAAPTALFTHNNSDFRWVAFAEGPGHIYAAGFSGDKSKIYRTAVRAEGVGLDAPVVAGELPDGEIIRSIHGYLGFMVLGSDRGVRFATLDGTGNLVIGQLIDDPEHAVLTFEPQGRFVWFGWTNIDGDSTGLGRLDLSVFTDALKPAYATDIYAGLDAAGAGTTVQGAVTSVVTFQDVRVFAVSSVGVFAEETTFGAVGRIDSGLITYGMPDDKVAVFIDLNHEPLPASSSVEVLLATDEGHFVALGTSDRDNDTVRTFSARQEMGSRFEVRLVLDGGPPVLTRYTLRSYPAFVSGEIIILPLLLYERVEVGDVLRHQDPKFLFDTIKSMADSHRLVNFQIASESFPVFIEDTEWQTHHRTIDNSWWQGTLSVKLKRVT